MQAQHFVEYIGVMDATAKLGIGLLRFQAPLRYRWCIQVDNLQAAFMHFLNGIVARLAHRGAECLARLAGPRRVIVVCSWRDALPGREADNRRGIQRRKFQVRHVFRQLVAPVEEGEQGRDVDRLDQTSLEPGKHIRFGQRDDLKTQRLAQGLGLRMPCRVHSRSLRRSSGVRTGALVKK